jgi:hemoglobin
MPSVFQAIGGSQAVILAVDAFYARALADELLAPYFDGVDLQRQKRHTRAFLAARRRWKTSAAGALPHELG